jgi:alpha-mannosidase
MSPNIKNNLRLEKIEPTIFLRRGPNGLEQRIRLTVANSGAVASGTCEIQIGNESVSIPIGPIPAGESIQEVYLKEVASPCCATAVIKIGAEAADQKVFDLKPQRHWVVHVVQASHHDVGYTDLASNVLLEHDRHLDRVIEYAAATKDFPEDAKFRMIIEQAWSVDHYLKTAPPARAAALVNLMRTGRVELTALFGNMTTEICGHETLTRCVYHAFRLKRQYGIPIISAEHNDIPGFSWGLSTVLTEAGIKLFSPELPLYYNWGASGPVRSFWDQKAIFGYDGPGAFWWQAPSGKRVLFWDGNTGCGGDRRLIMPSLEGYLAGIEKTAFPF